MFVTRGRKRACARPAPMTCRETGRSLLLEYISGQPRGAPINSGAAITWARARTGHVGGEHASKEQRADATKVGVNLGHAFKSLEQDGTLVRRDGKVFYGAARNVCLDAAPPHARIAEPPRATVAAAHVVVAGAAAVAQAPPLAQLAAAAALPWVAEANAPVVARPAPAAAPVVPSPTWSQWSPLWPPAPQLPEQQPVLPPFMPSPRDAALVGAAAEPRPAAPLLPLLVPAGAPQAAEAPQDAGVWAYDDGAAVAPFTRRNAVLTAHPPARRRGCSASGARRRGAQHWRHRRR